MSILLGVFGVLAALLSAGVGWLYLYFMKKYEYWGKKGVPYAKPTFPFGNIGEMGFKKSTATVIKELYDESKHEKMYGLWSLHRPSLLINDPELIKTIMVSEFMSFHDHEAYYNEKDDPLSAHLFFIKGTKWRNIRVKLTPTFTSGKMKMMFPLVLECAEQLQEACTAITNKDGIFEAKELFACFSTDVISACAFGIQSNSLKTPNSEFREMGRKIFEPNLDITLRNVLAAMVPDVAEFFKITTIPKDVTKFFLDMIGSTMQYRIENNVRQNDFMQLLIDLRTKGYIDDPDNKMEKLSGKDKFTFEQAAAQAYLFFLGGFETTSSVMQFTLYELAKNPQIQERLRQEILKGLEKTEGKITYENVHSMQYMGRVIEESLRKYPPATILNRTCTKDFKVPDSEVVIEKGTTVFIPSYGIHMDPEYFPEPEKFDPDRFLEEEISRRHHFTFIPFGEGPRACIGMRFAYMQVRVGVAAILSKFRIEICDQTPDPVVIDPKSLVMLPKGGMYLKLTPT